MTFSFIAIQIYILSFNLIIAADWTLLYVLLPGFIQAAILGGAIAEETGWRGFTLPKMMVSQNALVSSVIIGIIWACWHIPLNLIPGANIPVALDLSSFFAFFFAAISLSVIMTWLFNNTRGSILICYLFHAAANSLGFLALYNFEDFGTAWLYVQWFQIILRSVLILLIIFIFGFRFFSRKYKDKEEYLISLNIIKATDKL